MRRLWPTGRFRVALGVVASLLAVTLLVCCRWHIWGHDPPRPGVTWANVRRIEVGMTQPEVEGVVGRPPQVWWRGPAPLTDNSPPGCHTVLLWSDMECDILVYVDGNGRVIGREGVGSGPPSWYDRLRHWLGL